VTNRIGDSLFHFGPNEELIHALADAHVRFVVVGGLAVSWHCPARTADDMDLLVEPTDENSERIALALGGFGMRGFNASSFARLGLQVPLKQTFHAELLTPETQADGFSAIEARAVAGKLFGVPVRIAAVTDLIAMKKRAASAAKEQRVKHLRDIELLVKHGA
jgi:hypothetical protein